MEALGQLFRAIFRMWDTPYNFPIIGQASLFDVTIALAVLSIICGLINRLLGGDGEE